MHESELHTLDFVNGIFKDIASARGKHKEAVLSQWKNDPDVKTYLNFLLNPFMTYGVKETRLRKTPSLEPTHSYETFRDLLTDFAAKKGITDQDIANALSFMDQLTPDLKAFAKGILTKSLRLGITGKTVNKVFESSFIPDFGCMLAEKYFDHPDHLNGKTFAVTEKLDGIRCLAVVTNEVSLFSRQGQPIKGLSDIENDLMKARENWKRDFVLDGELLITNRDNLPSSEQYKATTQIVRRIGPKSGITYNVFDYLPLSDFISKQNSTPYRSRKELLDLVADGLEYVTPLPWLYCGDDTSVINGILNKELKRFHEGLMINITDVPYEFKRTKNLLKVKVMNEVDLEIKHIVSGTGRLSDTMGSILVDYKDSLLGVGSGFDDATRDFFWKNRSKLIGRVVTIRYFEETHNADGTLSLRFPVFVELREEGKEVSYA